MTIDLSTPMLGPVDIAADPDPRFFGGAYDDATVRLFWGELIGNAGRYGFRPSLIAAQVAKETAWFRFGGDVPADAFNLAGLGATGGGAQGTRYVSIIQGLDAVFAHHLTYHYGAVENWPVNARSLQPLDYRYDAVLSTGKAGTIRLLADLVNGVWAYTASIPVGSLANGYATGIAAIADTLSIGSGPPAPTPQPGGNVPNIIDLRGVLPTNPGGGSGQKMAAPVGLVLHYSAVHYDDSRDIIEIMKSEAAYQIGPYLREYSLAYHYVVDWRDGQVYQTRDEDDILWHVGSWVPGGNGTGISIHLPGDANTRLTDAALAGLVGLFDWLRAKHNIPPEMVRPHRFFGTSTCPGDYLSNVVYQYNRGEIGGVPVATAIKDDVTGKTLANAMYEFYLRTGGLDVHGRPLTEEYQGIWPDDPKGSPKRTIQITERSVLGLFDENKDPYRVQVLRLGATFAAAHGFTGEGIPTIAAPPAMKGAKK